ncbi:uncharacterized protein LOC131640082 [Vicia villosa]|uniref:uncharacterized protein LOC131640082 n=1 Tax=Vicia villosa TaxID=3911 RepID=UPI00273B4D6A|nr:uncharacterized protein LOC131640082 [Vicia villosa]
MESQSGRGSNIHHRTHHSTNSSETEPFNSQNKPEHSHHDPIHFMPNPTPHNENATFHHTNDQTNLANPFGEFHSHYPNNSDSSYSSSQNPFLVFGDHDDANDSHKLHDHAPFEANFHHQLPSYESSSLGNPFRDPHKIDQHHDHDDDWHHQDHWNFPDHEETSHASSSSQLSHPLFTLESTQNQQLDDANDKNHKGFEPSTQRNMHDSHSTGFESSTQQHMHDSHSTGFESSTHQHEHSLSASSNTEKDHVHPKSQKENMFALEASDDDMPVRSMPKHEQKSSTQQNMHDSRSIGFESSSPQHKHDFLSSSRNTEKDTHVHQKSRKDSDDDKLVNSMQKQEQKSSTQQNMNDSRSIGFESSSPQHKHDSISSSSNTEKDTHAHQKSRKDSDDNMPVSAMPKHEQKSSTQQNMRDSHSTGFESSTQHHMHDSVSASRSTEKDTHAHQKSRKDSDDNMPVSAMPKQEQKSSTHQNMHDSHSTGFESSTQQHKNDSLSASRNTEKDTHVHPKSQKENTLASESNDDDFRVRPMPKHEQQKSSTVVLVPETIQNPPIQIMERQENGSTTPSSTPRIPLHVFARDKLNAQWSNASNESLFSIQMGKSFSNDMAWLNKSGELDKNGDHMNYMSGGVQSNHPPLSPQPQATKFNDISANFTEQHQSNFKVTEAKAAETMREVIMETSTTPENDKSKGSTTFSIAAMHSDTLSSSNNDNSRHSNGSTQSFAFKSYADGEKAGDKPGEKPLSSKHDEETKKQPKQSGQQNAKTTVAPSAAQNTKPTSNAPQNKWLSCFTCCH